MNAAVVIGVDEAGGGLRKLSAAATGAREVAEWLERDGYSVDLFADDQAPVMRRSVFEAVERLVSAGNVERLVIYFAGHGFLKGPLDEFWLLSEASSDSAEAVNVSASIAMGRFKGIPRIVFISDACRTVPQTGRQAGVAGASIFPTTQFSSQSSEIDSFYGTHPGDPAYERSGDEAEKSHGLFTEELLRAHRDAPPEALVSIAGRKYVRSRWLKEVLRSRVDDRAQAISLVLTQKPDVRLESQDGYIAQNEGAAQSTLSGASEGLLKPGQHIVGKVHQETSGLVTGGDQSQSSANTGVRQPEKEYGRRVELLHESSARSSTLVWANHESRIIQRLTCRGGSITNVCPANGLVLSNSGVLKEEGVIYFALEGAAAQVGVSFSDGTSMLLPMLRERHCEIVLHDGKVLSVAYRRPDHSDESLDRCGSEFIAAATLGQLSADRKTAEILQDCSRTEGGVDPVLAMLAALSFALLGDVAAVRRVQSEVRGTLDIDLFDISLLARMSRSAEVFPAIPMMSRTWSLLEAYPVNLPESVKQLPRVPGFWTVFEAEATTRLFDYIKRQSDLKEALNG